MICAIDFEKSIDNKYFQGYLLLYFYVGKHCVVPVPTFIKTDMKIEKLSMLLNTKEVEHKELDLKIKYQKQYLSHDQLKIFRKRRAILKKQINDYKAQIQTHE